MRWETVQPGIQKCRGRSYRLRVAIARKEIRAPSNESLQAIIELRAQVEVFKREGTRLGHKQHALYSYVQERVDQRREPQAVHDSHSVLDGIDRV